MANNDYSSEIESLEAILNKYELVIFSLEDTKKKPSKIEALEILFIRDALKKVLNDYKQMPRDIVFQIMTLDARLKKEAYKINEVIDLEEYRATLPAPPEDWWWQLDITGKPHPRDYWDELWGVFRAVFWTGNLALLVAIVTRFISAGSGIGGALGVVIPSLLTFASARNDFTKKGQTQVDNFLIKIGLTAQWQQEAKLVGDIVLFGLLLGLWSNLPFISELYNQRGVKIYQQGQLASAEENFTRAIAIDPNNLTAHYNLGNLYEDKQDLEQARTNYLIAAKGNMPQAYNNLARLSIWQKELNQAVVWVQQGLAQPSPLPVQYSLYKNLGWARFEQQRYPEAKEALLTATELLELGREQPNANQIRNQGSAYCLLAQVLEQQKQQETLTQWNKCYQLVKDTPPEERSIEEDSWFYLACNKLKESGQSCQNQ